MKQMCYTQSHLKARIIERKAAGDWQKININLKVKSMFIGLPKE